MHLSLYPIRSVTVQSLALFTMGWSQWIVLKLLLFGRIIFGDSGLSYDNQREYYSHWMSISSIFSEYYGFDIYEYKLYELILAGSRHSGMYEQAMRTKLEPSTDSYFSAIKYFNNTDQYIKWSVRQHSSIYNQLMAGN